ncbi:MAG: alpha-1,2-fucosyltransferase [Flavisolibacter sp.]|nr:alpha-1,2-fucosyltransferase [Flavisolibacter sp.]
MSLHLWNSDHYFQRLPSTNIITLYGRKRWDFGLEYKTPQAATTDNARTVFTMPSFGRNGRWGNMVFQYLFMRILALNNNREIELYRVEDWISDSMNLYEDMCHIPTVQTKSDTILIDSYHLFPDGLFYIPGFICRAIYVSKVRLQKCFILENADEAINKPLPLNDDASIEVEGLFMMNPRLYKKQYKEFISNKLLQPNIEFGSFIHDCVKMFGQDKTIIGIHVRRGDFVADPLGQKFQFPIPIKYYVEWLVSNIACWKNPVLYVCSDDPNVYKEFEEAGLDVVHTKKLLPEGEISFKLEQVEWEILRHCHVLLTSNSSFSFSAALLSHVNATCYRFSLSEKKFVYFDPWDSEPLEFCTSSPYLWSYLYSRFTLVWNMVSKRSALIRLLKDVRDWVRWKKTKVFCLYFIYGRSLIFYLKLFNVLELFQLSNKYKSDLDYNQPLKIKL